MQVRITTCKLDGWFRSNILDCLILMISCFFHWFLLDVQFLMGPKFYYNLINMSFPCQHLPIYVSWRKKPAPEKKNSAKVIYFSLWKLHLLLVDVLPGTFPPVNWSFFLFWVFFRGHWRSLGEQGKRYDHPSPSSTSRRSRTFRNLQFSIWDDYLVFLSYINIAIAW